MKRVLSHEAVPGGFMVTVEVPGAFTDGTSRLDKVFVADAAVRGKTQAQQLHAIQQAVDVDPLAAVVGADVTAPAETREMLEDRMEALYADWQRWKATHAEATSRGLAANVVTALLNRTNAAWAAYVSAIQSWRNV